MAKVKKRSFATTDLARVQQGCDARDVASSPGDIESLELCEIGGDRVGLFGDVCGDIFGDVSFGGH